MDKLINSNNVFSTETMDKLISSNKVFNTWTMDKLVNSVKLFCSEIKSVHFGHL